MRLSMKDVPVRVAVAPTSPCPVRLRIAGLSFGLGTGEAINLARQLADAVEKARQQPRGDSNE
ncbi:MAG: hypothetical protein KDB50_10025 [Mycobacterium sp.]|nr:hypothetical protein [Mycobacterium sp.]